MYANIEKVIMEKYIKAGELLEGSWNGTDYADKRRQGDVFWDMLTQDEKDTALGQMVHCFARWYSDINSIAVKAINKQYM